MTNESSVIKTLEEKLKNVTKELEESIYRDIPQ